MARYFARRLYHAVIVLFVVSLITFGMLTLAPGGPEVMIDPSATPRDRELMREQLGLNDPIYIRYARWIASLVRGDLGRSFVEGSPVLALILDRLPNTLLLTGTAFSVAIVAAIPAGILSAMKPYSRLDYSVTAASFVGVSLPSFWFGILLIILFGVKWRVLPPGGMKTIGSGFSVMDIVQHLIMPALVLGTVYMAELARFTRSAVMQVKSEDFVRTAMAKGLTRRVVTHKHVLRNALIPVVTVIGLRLPRLVGGSAIIESIFSWPGMGRLGIEAAYRRDYPVVMGITVMFAVVVVLSSLLVDVLYVWMDPRIKLDARET